MSRPEVIFHIGPHKTGTTAIQGVLYANRAALASLGIVYYPETGIIYFGHHNLAWDKLKDGRFDANLGSWEQLLSELSRFDDTLPVVLSSEDFSLLSVSALSETFSTLREYPVTLLYVYRPLADFFRSLHAEAVKTGMTTTALEDFVSERLRTDHRACIGEYLAALANQSTAKIRVIQYSKNVLPDVMACLKVPGAKNAAIRANTRLPTTQLRRILAHRRNSSEQNWQDYFREYVTPFIEGKLTLDAEPAPESDFELSERLLHELGEYDKRNLELLRRNPAISFSP